MSYKLKIKGNFVKLYFVLTSVVDPDPFSGTMWIQIRTGKNMIN